MLYANVLIGLREGLEATMVVMLLAAYLTKTGRTPERRWMWAGVVAALAMTVAVFLVLHFGTKTLTTQGQELVGGVASLVTVAMITWLLFWMHASGKNIAAELNGTMERAIGPRAVFTVALFAVGREGIETILLVFDSITSDNLTPFVGLGCGVTAAVALGVALFRGAIRVDLKLFFRVTGILLVFVAAGILRYGIHDLQEAGVLPGLQTQAFDISDILVPGTWFASLLEGMFNVVPAPSILAFAGWLTYLAVALPLFLRTGRRGTGVKQQSNGAGATGRGDTAPANAAPADAGQGDTAPADAAPEATANVTASGPAECDIPATGSTPPTEDASARVRSPSAGVSAGT